MIAKIGVLVFLSISLIVLVRRRTTQIELLVPAFFAVLVLGVLSTFSTFVDYLGVIFQIGYAPIAVLFVVIFLLFWIIIVLAAAITRIRERQLRILRHIVLDQLSKHEVSQTSFRGEK
jgi:fluoride ion exporter CrcB/FEX